MFFVFLLLTFNVNSIYAQKSKMESIELYIAPRNVRYGWDDSSVFNSQPKLKKKSIKVIYSKKTFETTIVKRKVYELFYIKTKINRDLYQNMEVNKDTSTFQYQPRIMLIINNSGTKDTICIDSNYSVERKKIIYVIPNKLKIFIENHMPSEIRENWVDNIPAF